MRAITQNTFGGPEVLEVTDLPVPDLGPGRVLVRVKAAGVNPIELFIRSGAFPLLGEPPFVLGWDLSGVVERVEPGVHRFKEGDEVYGLPLFPLAAGAYAEYVSAPARQLARKPAGISHEEAAALPLVGLTAWQAFAEIAELRPGQRVLVHGAGGGLGHVAVQLAKHMGAQVVGTASAGKHEFLRGLGADRLIDHRTADYAEVLRDDPVDVVLETLGGGHAERSFTILRPGGLLITAVERTSTTLPGLAAEAGVRFAPLGVEPDAAGLESLTALVEAGRLRPYLQEVLPLEQAAKAHEIVATGSVRGKVVLSV
ncbi:NADP-dependent oxidoreductase [Streptomyces sp. HPF1205]|uniref:NADP-dependent oxidoreductase n=1 Tax=Streptomyces sp. HPF1205 TaxID=2873262 RepID=UPI001CEC167B|nr:NADP-dependent oxidoreductase [Streptomyces sp. HPF1205]